MVNAATTELSDLINRLDLMATPEPSPGRRSPQGIPRQSPDATLEYVTATVQRAIQQSYPDATSSVQSKGSTTVIADSSPATNLMPHPSKLYNMNNLPFSGSMTDLRKGVSIGPGPFLSNTPRHESSITSLRPYQMAKNLPAIYLSPSRESESPTSIVDSPLNQRAIRRPRRSIRPRAQSSEESLRQLSPRSCRDPGIRGMLGTSYDDTDESGLLSGRDDPTSDSADDVADSDIPDELRMIIGHKEDDTASSVQSLKGRLLPDATSQSVEQTARSYPYLFSITVTPPSLSSHDSDAESPIEDERDREDDTGKKSFDFTGEINRLNRGGARTSFVEQLAAAFRVPDELKSPTAHDFGLQDSSPTVLQWDPTGFDSNVKCFIIQVFVAMLTFRLQSILRKPSDGHLDPDFKFGAPPSAHDTTNTVKAMSMVRSDCRYVILITNLFIIVSNLDIHELIPRPVF